MNLRDQQHKFCFTGNPIRWAPQFPDNANDPRGGVLVVTQGSRELYQGRVSPDMEIDFADIARAYTDYLPDAASGESLEVICTATDLEARKISVCVEYDGYTDGCSFIPLIGKMPLIGNLPGVNYFEAAFLKEWGNYLLTDACCGWRFEIKETELTPMYFIRNNANPWSVEARTKAGHKLELGSVAKGIYAIDFDAIRRKFVEVHDILPAHISIYTAGQFSFDCMIIPAEASVYSQKIKYRNSLGCFATLELNGTPKLTVSAGEMPEPYEIYNANTGAREQRRDRGELFQTLNISGYAKSHAEARVIQEMANSDEVYLMCGTRKIRVIPTLSDNSLPNRYGEPEEYELSLRFAVPGLIEWGDEDDLLLPRLKPRAFDDTFNDKFQ